MERGAASIELKSISCKGVKSFNLFQKPSLYAAVSVASGGDQKQRQRQQKKTPVDRDGGENPEWDQPMRIEIDGRDHDLSLEFEVKAEGILGDRAVGRARIPVADLDFTGAVRHVSYQVRRPDGKPNGVLSFSYRIDSSEATVSLPETVFPAPAPAVDYYPPPTALAGGYYRPPPPPTVAAVSYYPPPEPAFCCQAPDAGYYYPRLDPGYGYPAPVPAGGGYYPPPPPVHVAYPPQPAPAYYYPVQQDTYDYRQGGWGRGLYGYN